LGATLEEHNKNVVKYHRLLAGLPADPPPPPPPPPSAKKRHIKPAAHQDKKHRGKAR